MAPVGSAVSGQPVKGVVLMALAMLLIPVVDGIAKHLSADYSPLFLSWARYIVASTIVLPAAAILRGRQFFPRERQMSHVARTVCLVAAMTLYFLAIARIPLATAVSAYFVGPIIAVALSVILLKERLTRRRFASLVLGFAGAIIILRPGTVIEPGILLALGAGLFFALYLVATRHASTASDPIETLAFQCVVGTMFLTPQALLSWSTPTWEDLRFFLGLGALSAVSHALAIAAFRYADVSSLSPLVYLELIGAAVIGYFAFNEVPHGLTIVGAALIVFAGYLLLNGQTRLGKEPRQPLKPLPLGSRTES
ncbi:DMT family transporter [Cognatiyoonia sp. IB215182]|uniref:DMT family transporter n=1 Tax=Cognatiyoonia sp. IB215182 TaxID=3097353 RepID=UPI002A11665F|nr:DMT family transporter [Cognatiyoonia sp. IB215182]MDX8355582.1 DMT family transporter [Cognatiyoonia sp. IB215182]